MEIHVTRHAIQRYRQRIADIPDTDIIAALSSPVIQAASDFGARYVRLSSGHRVVIIAHYVVTILEPDQDKGCLSLAMDRRRREARG